jgi:hypothetical protein
MSSPSPARQTTAASMASDRPLRASRIPARRPRLSSIGTTSTPARSQASGTCLPSPPRQTCATTPPQVTGGLPARRSRLTRATTSRSPRSTATNAPASRTVPSWPSLPLVMEQSRRITPLAAAGQPGGRAGQPPMADIGRAAWRKPGSLMLWPGSLTATARRQIAASSSSPTPARSGMRRSLSSRPNRSLRTCRRQSAGPEDPAGGRVHRCGESVPADGRHVGQVRAQNDGPRRDRGDASPAPLSPVCGCVLIGVGCAPRERAALAAQRRRSRW